MLSVLHIENIALIEQADIYFQQGFNVLTGETGAGKSIIIDAISAILGQRAYRDTIRTGTNRAFISGIFHNVQDYAWFEQYQVPKDSGEVLIQREIMSDGRNNCRVNGIPVSVTALKALGAQLIQIHGQHDTSQLLDEDNHLAMLDSYAGHRELLQEYQEAYQMMDEVRRRIRKLHMDEAEKQRRIEGLSFQIREIESAALKPGEDEELEQKRKVMRSSEKLMSALNAATHALYGSDDADGARSLVETAKRELSSVSDVSETIGVAFRQVEQIGYELFDAAERVRDLRDSFNFSAADLEKVENRLDVIHKLRRKYGTTCEEILAYLEKSKNELSQLSEVDDTIALLQKEFREHAKKAKEYAAKLTESRNNSARMFERHLIEELRQLDMPKVQFLCEIYPLEHLNEVGGDGCHFLMTANAGEELKQMSRVASGGEMARIMLAVKNVMSEKDGIPTLIFDEVDTGVSGRAAQKVAEKLHAVSSGRQVLCVTHLPQIAAAADTHFLISKAEKSGRTFTSVTPMDIEGRKNEIARLIGGARITETTLKSAEEMLII